MSNYDNPELKYNIELIKNNPIFWSRLGWGFDPPEIADGKIKLFENNSIHVKYHEQLYKRGIIIHSSILPTGWIGDNEYDYSTTDKVLEDLFTALPDIYYIPRIKLNAPLGWLKTHPKDVFVYHNGPRNEDDISALIGTDKHDYLGFDSYDGGEGVNSKFDTRKNVGGVIGLQSFSSKQWQNDAGIALKKLVEHIENSKYGKNIIGYHIAYGCCGETTLWGTWERNLEKRGDYGINAIKNFIEYAEKYGENYDIIPEPTERYSFNENSLDSFFYTKNEDKKCVLYSKFISDTNVDAIEHFCKIIKDTAPNKATGIFYGYIIEVSNSSHAGHLGIDRVLNSKYVDFISSPKGYYRVGPLDPGFGQAPANSASLKKVWVEEIDNRTHLYCGIPDDSVAKNMEQTRAVYWREFTKNLSYNQGYWWMDLGGGWLNSKEILDEIELLNKTGKQLVSESNKYENPAEILLVMDDEVLHHMRPNEILYGSLIAKIGARIKECGAPISFYRVSDLPLLNMKKYKIIFLLNIFDSDYETVKNAIDKTNKDTTIVYNYAYGYVNNGFASFDNIYKLTGFNVDYASKDALPDHYKTTFPILKINTNNGIKILKEYPNKEATICERKGDDGRTYIYNTMPIDTTTEDCRSILENANVHLYAPVYCTVNCDSRFIYVIAGKDINTEIILTKKCNAINLFTNEKFIQTDRIPVKLKAGTGAFIKYID